jgi:hypothetical protein
MIIITVMMAEYLTAEMLGTYNVLLVPQALPIRACAESKAYVPSA